MAEHRPLDKEALAEITHFAGEANKFLRLRPMRTPRQIVTSIGQWIDRFRESSEPPEDNLVGGAAIRFGCLWGDAVVREYGWHWVEASHDDETYHAVVSRNHGYIVYPIVRTCHWLTDQDRQPNPLLLFDTLGSMPPAKENEFVSVE